MSEDFWQPKKIASDAHVSRILKKNNHHLIAGKPSERGFALKPEIVFVLYFALITEAKKAHFP
jgi:hypothetical protein